MIGTGHDNLVPREREAGLVRLVPGGMLEDDGLHPVNNNINNNNINNNINNNNIK